MAKKGKQKLDRRTPGRRLDRGTFLTSRPQARS